MHDYRFIAILEPAPTDPCNHEAICRLLADETDMIMEKNYNLRLGKLGKRWDFLYALTVLIFISSKGVVCGIHLSVRESECRVSLCESDRANVLHLIKNYLTARPFDDEPAAVSFSRSMFL